MLIRHGSGGRGSGTNATVVADFIGARTVDEVRQALLRQVANVVGGGGATLLGPAGDAVAWYGLSGEQATALAAAVATELRGSGGADPAPVARRQGSIVLPCLGGFVVAPTGGRMWRLDPSTRGRLRTIADLATLAFDRAEAADRERVSRQVLQEREAQLAEAQRTARLGSYTWEVATGAVTWSDELYLILGLEPGVEIDHVPAFLERVHPDDRDRVVAALRAASVSTSQTSIEYRVLLPGGVVRWIHGITRPVESKDGQVLRIAGTLQDVTDVHAAEERFRALLEAAPDAMVIAEEDGSIALVNAQTERMFGYSADELIGRDVEVLIPDRFRDGHVGRRLAFVATGPPRLMGHGQDLVARRKDGSELLVEIALGRIDTPSGTLVSAAIRDVTERIAAEQAIAFHATHDTLTRLPNRVLLLDRLDQELSRRTRHDRGVGVLFVDLDHFKWVNDSLGHAAGDGLLAAVADRLCHLMRPGDTVARFGGDEFVVLCQDVHSLEDVVTVAERLKNAMRAPLLVGANETTITVSIGISYAGPGTTATADDLVRDADTAMYEAKERGRDRHDVFDSAARRRAATRQEMSHALRQGIDRDELLVVFQPEIDLGTNTVVGVEALARWAHPTRGMLDPEQFIPVAEESGVILPLGQRILRMACQQVVGWGVRQRALTDLTLSVNLSARQLLAPNLPAIVEQALEETGLAASRLCLEITESVLLRDADSSGRALELLKELGVQIGVDDFGTGYSSLTYLKRFPVDILKIDRSFVAGVGTNREDRAIVASVIDLAHAFDLTTVAEGVESRHQHEELRSLGCSQAQGYLWSQPLPAPAAEAWITEWRSRAPANDLTADVVVEDDGEAHTVLLVEDDASLRELLRVVLDEDTQFRVVAEAGDGREAIALARRFRPDVAVLDLAMPGTGGLEAIPHILGVSPRTKVVVLSGLEPAAVADAVRRLGAVAYLRKGHDTYRLPELLRHSLAS